MARIRECSRELSSMLPGERARAFRHRNPRKVRIRSRFLFCGETAGTSGTPRDGTTAVNDRRLAREGEGKCGGPVRSWFLALALALELELELLLLLTLLLFPVS